MKRSIGWVVFFVVAGLLLAGCKTVRNDRDIKPVSSAAAVVACSDRCQS